MFNETVKAAIMIIICVLLLVAAAIIGRGNTAALMLFENEISEESLAAGLYYSTQALPCMSRNPETIDETKRFVLDTEILNAERSSGYGQLSCADYGAVKYEIGIYDLEVNTNQWTFKNFQPLEENLFMPRYGQVVVLEEYSEKHRAFIGVYIDFRESSGGLPLEMFCNSTAESEPSDFTSVVNLEPLDDNGYGVNDTYSYPTNGCKSENCIKGPGQLIPTCQPVFHTYSKDAGANCLVDYECKSVSCNGVTCVDKEPPAKLIKGQPCSNDVECISGTCAHDKRCRAERLNGIDISVFNFV